MPDFLELKGVQKGYPKLAAPVLDGVDLTISPGERLVILGASGSGKTTLLHLLGLLLRADGGEILIGGENTATWPEQKRANWRNKYLGYVFQDFGLIPELTLKDNVSLPLRIAGERQIENQAKKLLAAVGLAGRENAFPSEISGGESQRVAIARALIGSPKLVLADEPTGNLQQQQGMQIAQLFQELQRDLRFALVVVTHNEQIAHMLQAKILRLSSGLLENL